MGLLVGLYSTYAISNITFFIMCYCDSLQVVTHAAIAVNRYTVIVKGSTSVSPAGETINF